MTEQMIEHDYCTLCHQTDSHAEDCPMKDRHLTWDRAKADRIGRALARNDWHCPCVANSKGDPKWLCPCEQVREGGDCHCGLYEKGNGQ